MEQSTSEIKNFNLTRFVLDREIYGSKKPSRYTRECSESLRVIRSFVRTRQDPLRVYQLSEIVRWPSDLENNVFLGFSLDGHYLFSYRENYPNEEEDVADLLVGSGRSYEFTVWQFVPGKRLKFVLSIPLFGGETFLESLCIRVEQRLEMPTVCIVIGNMMGGDCNMLTQTIWHSLMIIPSASIPAPTFQRNFHALHAISSGLHDNDDFLVICTGDELILLNLKRICVKYRLNSSKLPSYVSLPCLDVRSIGDISEKRSNDAHYFSYTHQTLKWCTEDSSALLGSNDVGLIDYHLFVDSLTDDACEGCIFALFDVDTNERSYYESMFNFRWNLRTNKVERLKTQSQDVTDRSKEPGKQQKAFNELRKHLFGRPAREIQQRYQLSNMPVLQGYSLQRILDSTGCIAVTL